MLRPPSKTVYPTEEITHEMNEEFGVGWGSNEILLLMKERLAERRKSIELLEQESASLLDKYCSSLVKISQLKARKEEEKKLDEIREKNKTYSQKMEKFLKDFHSCATAPLTLELIQAYISDPEYKDCLPEIMPIYERLKNG